ncbi:MAG TPA: peptidoglycan-binding protein, partial [Polyangiaceae bacterium]|nr:peptidoglycan-binding protein [Polyangiaceae bacterium]
MIRFARRRAERRLLTRDAAATSASPPRLSALGEVTAPTRVTTRMLQTELRRAGYDPGRIDGRWGPRTERALKRFLGDISYREGEVLPLHIMSDGRSVQIEASIWNTLASAPDGLGGRRSGSGSRSGGTGPSSGRSSGGGSSSGGGRSSGATRNSGGGGGSNSGGGSGETGHASSDSSSEGSPSLWSNPWLWGGAALLAGAGVVLLMTRSGTPDEAEDDLYDDE